VIGTPALTGWWLLAPLAAARPSTAGQSGATPAGHWWWLGRPALLVLFGAGVVFGMLQSAVLSYLPLYGVQVLGFTAIAAGALVAAAQAGGAVARLGLGAASDRWLDSRRPPWLVLSSAIAAVIFATYALAPVSRPAVAMLLAFAAGVGAHGWVGIYFITSAEAGGPRQSGLLSGVSFGAIVVGIVLGAPLFGVVLQASDSYRAAWGVFAALAVLAAMIMALAGAAIHRECERARGGA
jgi:predicted MFS family arabinose efflux permease